MTDRTGPRRFVGARRGSTQAQAVEMMRAGASDLEVRGFLLAVGMQRDSAVVILSRARIEVGRLPDGSIRGRKRKIEVVEEIRRPAEGEDLDGRGWANLNQLRQINDRFLAALRQEAGIRPLAIGEPR